jgi:hypothetical protein
LAFIYFQVSGGEILMIQYDISKHHFGSYVCSIGSALPVKELIRGFLLTAIIKGTDNNQVKLFKYHGSTGCHLESAAALQIVL